MASRDAELLICSSLLEGLSAHIYETMAQGSTGQPSAAPLPTSAAHTGASHLLVQVCIISSCLMRTSREPQPGCQRKSAPHPARKLKQRWLCS